MSIIDALVSFFYSAAPEELIDYVVKLMGSTVEVIRNLLQLFVN